MCHLIGNCPAAPHPLCHRPAHVQWHTSPASSAHPRQQQSGAAEQLRFVVYDPFRFRTGWLYDENTVLLKIQDVILIFFLTTVNRFNRK